MSEGDVSLIHDEDLLRRMWQQTEDFGRKKEIRAHMYRLREERLRMLYSPEPARKDMGGSLVATLADDGFERAKRSEVRGGPSPPRDRPSAPTAPTDPATGELQLPAPASTAGWEVQRSSATADGGRTQVSSVRADLRGAYEAEGGGRGHFAAADRRSLAVTEGDSFRRSEASATTAAQDHLVQRSADGATVTATSSAAHSAVRTVTSSSSRVSRQDDAAARGERERQGELVSRRVERPDERTTVLVETRQLPDGTTVTSTRREFRDAAAAREARTERHTRAEETETRTATSHRTHAEDSTRDVVRSQALADEADFEANHTKHTTRDDHSSRTQKTTEAIDSRQSGKTVREATVDRRDVVDSRRTDFGSNITEDYSNTERHTGQWHAATDAHDHHDRRGYVDETDRATSRRATDASDTTDRVTEVFEKTNEQYQTTYKTDYTQKRVSSECSPTHQAWASTLRGDSPRRSASPEKARRGGTPLRRDRASPGPGQARAPSASPDRKPQQPRSPASPGKGRPAAVSPTRPRASPESADRTTHVSPERKPYSSADKITRDHYKFVEEETKTHTRSDQRDVLHNGGAAAAGAPSTTAERSTSPSILRKASRSPSPPKGPVSFSQHDTDKYQSTTKHVSSKNTTNTTSLAKPTIEASPTTHVHNEYERQTKNTILTTKDSSSDKYDSLTRREKTVGNDVSPVKSPDAPRDTSPSKYGTYDRKRPTEGAGMVTTKESADVKYNSTRRDKDIRSDVSPMKSPGSLRDSSPSKHGIPGNKQRRTEQVEQSKTVIINESTDTQDDSSTPRPKSGQPQSQARQLSPTKKPRSSISPMKSPGKDNTHKQTSDFITTERTFEEINKKTRRLVTPSSSPTRKPHAVETEPSTGQSSPTTSVSGFIYYGAPDTRRQTIVTDLDDEEHFASQHTAHGTTTHERPQSLNLKRSPSPTKIPCRSPSPPQKAPPAKETLPRKSSLKKPPTLTNLPSPVEKPPSSFRVSPTGESEPEHKVVKKDRADKPTESDEKPKPPLERRETYTERCLKILGVLDDNRAPIAKKEHKPKSLRSPISAPPAVSPQSRQQSPRKGSPPKQTQHVNVTDFTIKQQEITSTKKISGKTKSPVRGNSPTKLQDIISIKTDINKTTDVIQSSFKNIRQSVEKEVNGYDHPKDDSTKPTRSSLSPEKKSPGSPGYRRDSPSRPNRQSPDRKPNYQKPESKNSQDETRQPRSSASPERKPGYMKNTVSSDTKVETKSKDFTSTTFLETTDRETGYQTSRESHQEEPSSLPVRSRPADQPAAEGSSSPRSSVSPNREHGYMKSTISSKQHEASTIAGHIDSETLHSEEYRTPTQPPLEEAPRSRSPSPAKAATRLTHDVTEFIQSEREKEILDRVQTSLRKLSPNRDHKSPSRENTPAKSTLSLQDIDVVTTADVQIDKNTTQTHTRTDSGKLNGEKPRPKSANILSSRTVSPTKKAASAPSKTPTSPTKARSVSPRKPLERPQSPHVPKTSGIKPRESTPSFIRKPTKVDVSFSRVDKVQSDAKKSTTTKQNSFSKTTSTFKSVASKVLSRAEAAPKRAPPPLRDNKENVSLRREEAKVARTSSDHAIRAAKPTPQRVRSRPEIQVTGTGTGTAAVTRGGLAPKPKSATALNTPTCDLGDVIVIVDVEQAKSSRESSPERRATCPTPVGPLEGPLEGAPRLPDAVSEPDDDWGQGQGRGIHEAECIVDVSDEGDAPARDECLLSVTAKVSRFTDKIAAAARPGEGAAAFGDAERREHSDFADDRLESDECLLSVSQKVSKFAKGPGQVREPSPARRIADEFDTGTVYQDDYTRMSVNDKAHLFVETARGTAAAAKPSPAPAPAPAFDADADADASLRSDDCLLSVSDKVNKFVRTAERFLESGETRTRRGPSDADALLKERYKDFLKQLQEDEAATAVAGGKGAEVPSFARETASWQGKAGDGAIAPAPARPAERAPAAPALRSGDAVKKAKAVFENIATSESVASASAKHTKATKLLDIGVMKKSPKTDSTTALHPSDEDSPDVTDSEADAHRPNPPRHTTTSTTTTSTSHSRSVLSRYPAAAQTEHAPPRDNPRQASDVAAKTQRTAAAAAAGQPREQTAERAAEAPVSTRRGSGKFGVELRRTSLEAPLQGLERRGSKGAGTKGEGRRGSADRPQPQVEDIYDLQLLEQMLEKVVGYEQRRRIRSQIRVARKRLEGVPSAPRSPEHRPPTKSPERGGQRRAAAPPPLVNGHAKGGAGPRPRSPEKRPLRQPSPEKRPLRQPSPEKRPLRQPSPEKRPRPRSPAKGAPRPPAKRISEYATAYMKKVGLDGAAEPPSASPDRAGRAHQASREQTTERTTTLDSDTGTGATRVDTFEQRTVQTSTSRTSNVSSSTVERRSSKESVRSSAAPAAAAGARSPSPGDRLYRRSPSPDFKRRATNATSATSAPAAGQPAWLASRNVHKVTSSTTTTSSSGGARSAGGVVEAVTSGYGPGPLDADGRPLFGIRALRTHDRTKQRDSSAASASEQEPSGGGGGQPDLERLLREPTARPARLHGLAAIANNYSGDARKKERGPPAPAAPAAPVAPVAPSPARGDRGERKPVRQKSVQLLTEKYIKSTSDTGKSDRPGGATYPKAGLILRSGGLRDSPQGDPGAGAGADVHMARATTTTTSTSTSSGARHERSFLDSTSKVTGVQDILSRMKNADIVIECGDTAEDSEARALLNKFLGATVLMAGMQSYVTETNANANAKPSRKLEGPVRGGGGSSSNRSSAPAPLSPADLARCWDERRLRQLLDECTEYEQRRLIRERLRDLMAERDACAAVAAGAEEEAQVEEVEVDEAEEAKANGAQQSETERVQAEVTVSVRKGSAEKTTSATKTTTTTTKTSKVGSASQPAQPASPFAKFRQLEKQNSTTSQNSAPAPTPPSPGSPSVVNGNRGGPLFKFTDPALQLSALTIKERLLQWCRDKTRDYENVKLENFSTSWADGLAFCALVHHFVPDAFDYSRLAEATAAATAAANAGQASAQQRRRNFTIAFKVADEKAGIYPLLDVEDMVAMRKPDWKCVFTYVQAIHRRFKDQP